MISFKLIRWLFAFLMMLIFSDCSIYTPKVAPFVNTKEKGDLQIDESIIISQENIPNITVGLGGAYAMTDDSYIQVYGSFYRILDPQYFIQMLGGYKFDLGNRTYLDVSFGYTHQKLSYTHWYNLNIKDISSKDYYGTFNMPFTKFQFVYNNNKNTLLSFGIKSGIMYPSLNDFNQKGVLIQPILYYMPLKSSKKSDYSFSISYSKLIPISNNRLDFNNDYLLDNFGLMIGISKSIRFDIKTINQRQYLN